jgi:L-rhamnose mutarotase
VSRRHVFTVNLKDDPAAIDAYRRYHRDVWPEVLQSLRQAGVERMDIYLLDRRAVMIVETAEGLDYRTAFQAHASSSERVAEWERLMASLQEPPPGAQPGERWVSMEPVFHLNHQEPPPVRLEPARIA